MAHYLAYFPQEESKGHSTRCDSDSTRTRRVYICIEQGAIVCLSMSRSCGLDFDLRNLLLPTLACRRDLQGSHQRIVGSGTFVLVRRNDVVQVQLVAVSSREFRLSAAAHAIPILRPQLCRNPGAGA